MKDYDIFAEFEKTAKSLVGEEKMEIVNLSYGEDKYYLVEIDLRDPDTGCTYKISIEKEEIKDVGKPDCAEAAADH